MKEIMNDPAASDGVSSQNLVQIYAASRGELNPQKSRIASLSGSIPPTL